MTPAHNTPAVLCQHCGREVDVSSDQARKWRGMFYHDACLAWVFGDDDAPKSDPAIFRSPQIPHPRWSR